MKYVFLLVGLLACQNKQIASNHEIQIRLREDMGTLDWNYGEVNEDVVMQLMEGLVSSDSSGKPIPALATHWERKNNVWTFFIRKARWSTGEPVCAENFVLGLKRTLKKGFSPFAHYFFSIKGAREFNQGQEDLLGIKAISCEKLEITLEKPIYYLPELLSHWTAFPVLKEGHFSGEIISTTGPYKLEKWIKDQKYILTVNPNFEGIPPKITKIIFQVVGDDHTALNLFETGKLDLIEDLPYADIPRLQDSKDYRNFPSHVGYYLGFNVQDPQLKQKEIRQALLKSLDLKEIPLFLKGISIFANGWIPESLMEHQKPMISFGKALHKKLKPLDLYFYSKNIHVPLVEWAQAQWKKNLGVEIHLHSLESKVYWSQVTLKKFPIFLSGVTAFFNSPLPFLEELKSESHANWTNWKNYEYDQLVDALSIESDFKKREILAQKAEEILLQKDFVIIPLYFRGNPVLIREKFTNGFFVNPMTHYFIKNINESYY